MTRLLAFALFLGLVSPAFALSKVLTFSEPDIQCVVPTDWIYRDRNGDLVNIVDPQHHRCFLLRVNKNTYDGCLDDPAYVKSLEDVDVSNGENIISRGMTEINGVQFYKLTMSKDLGTKVLNSTDYMAFANGYGYCVEATEFNDNPDADKDLQDMVSSVKFITPPVITKRNSFDALFASHGRGQHDVSPIARLLALAILLAFLSVPILLCLAIGLVIYLLVRKKPTAQPPAPLPSSSPPPYIPPPPPPRF